MTLPIHPHQATTAAGKGMPSMAPHSDPFYSSESTAHSGALRPSSGTWRSDKGKFLLKMSMTALLLLSGIGIWLWQREVARADDHERRLSIIESAAATERVRGELRDKRTDEIASDVKELLRRVPK